MNTPASPPISASLAKKMAWMHEPVRLTPGSMPWLVRRMLEIALHGFFCSLEQAILTLLELHRQGKLEPWPEQESEAEPTPHLSRHKTTSNPTAPRRGAGATHVLSSDSDVPKMGADAAEAGAGGEICIVRLAAGPAVPPRVRLRAVPLARPRSVWARARPASVRCRPAAFCRAAERGGKLASKSFRLFN